MAAKAGNRWAGGPFVTVDRADGLFRAAELLGHNANPPPNPREHARRQQLQAELDQLLADPLVPNPGTSSPQ